MFGLGVNDFSRNDAAIFYFILFLCCSCWLLCVDAKLMATVVKLLDSLNNLIGRECDHMPIALTNHHFFSKVPPPSQPIAP